MKAKKDKKGILVGRIAENLRSFYPELDRHFMCPTCLAVLPIAESSRISEAHITPRAAGGSLKTYICKDCNDKFGASQDRWLGDYLQLRRRFQERQATFLDMPSKPGYFVVDGTRVQGTFRTESDGSLGFYIYQDKTAPDALRRVLSSHPKAITIPMPLLGKKALVNVGFLTAAYLLWFKELGYSWALQAHLDQVRQQIQHPEQEIISGRFWVTCNDQFFEQPWVGVAFIRDEVVLVAAIADRLVLLPAADRKNFYSILEERFESLASRYHRLHFADAHKFGGPVGVVYRDRLMIAPDTLLREPERSVYIMYPPGDEFNPKLLFHTTEEDYTSRRNLPNHVLIKIEGQIEIPARGTGEPRSIDREKPEQSGKLRT
jgi:hypothetical protein